MAEDRWEIWAASDRSWHCLSLRSSRRELLRAFPDAVLVSSFCNERAAGAELDRINRERGARWMKSNEERRRRASIRVDVELQKSTQTGRDSTTRPPITRDALRAVFLSTTAKMGVES